MKKIATENLCVLQITASRMDQTQQKCPSKAGKRFNLTFSSSDTMEDVSGRFRQVNVVTEAASLLPSLASTFSLEHSQQLYTGVTTNNLTDGTVMAMSLQDGLQCEDYEDEFDNPDYVDTVKSTDSAGSFLRRSVSVPARPNPYEEGHRHMKDIFGGEQKLGESEEDKKWRLTMEDLLENQEYVDSLESQSSRKVLLAKAAMAFASGAKTQTTVPPVRHNYMHALLVLSSGFMLVFLAYMALRNLQSSLYSRGGLGLYVLTCVYISLLVGCMFAPTIVMLLRPKQTMVICMTGLLVFIMTNFYPTIYLLLPAACMVGFCLACLWTAQSTYMTSIAMSYAAQTGKSIQQVLTKFNGIFFMMFQTAQIIGGALSSAILMMSVGDTDANTDSHGYSIPNDSVAVVNLTHNDFMHCGASYSYAVASSDPVDIDRSIVYVMLSIFATFAMAGIIVILFFLDGLEGIMKKSHASVGGRLLATFRFLVDLRVVCLMGLMCYSFMQMSFMLGEFTKVC